jgi:hypothetical protein
MKTDYWEIEEIEKNIATIVKSELKDIISENEINEIIQKCGSDMSLMEKYVAKYAFKIDIDEEFDIDELKIIVSDKYEVDEVFRVLKYLSLFEHLGYREHKAYQIQIINEKLIKLPYTKVQSLIELLIDKKLISTKGYFIWLEKYKYYFFEKWISQFEEEQFSNFISAIEESETSSVFGRNVVNLSNKVKSSNLITQFTDENGLLRNYKFLNSETGSTLALNFVETESRSNVLMAIKSVLESKTIEELTQSFIEGRRNCIWLLEKLCYYNETAEDSIKLMFRLALAENEHIANNASSQFRGYYQPYLSATILSLEKRLKVLIVLEEVYGLNHLLLSAFDRILQVGNFIGNITTFGPRKEEYKSYDRDNIISIKELNHYYDSALNKLTSLVIENDNPFSEDSKNILLKRFFGQYTGRESNKALENVMLIIGAARELELKWRQLFETIIFKKRGITEVKLEPIKKILDNFKLQSVEQELDFKVINAPYKSEKGDNGWKDISKEEAIHLALKYIDSENKEWLNYIDKLLDKDQRQTYAFGQTMGEKFPNTDELFEKCMEIALTIEPENLNSSLITGIVAGKNNSVFTRQSINQLILKEHLVYIGSRLTRLIENELTLQDLKKLIPIFQNNSKLLVTIEYLNVANLSNEEIIEFINEIKEIDDIGHSFSLELLWDLFRKQDERWNQIKAFTRNLLNKKGLLNLKSLMGGTALHVEDLIKKLSNDDITKEEIKFFVSEILEGYEELFIPNETMLNIMIFHFLENHFDTSWPLIGKALLSDDYNGKYNLKNIGKYFKFDDDKLLIWTKNNRPTAPGILMEFIPFQVKEDESDGWSNLASELINLYGDDDRLLSSLASRLHNYFVTGSAVPIYEGRKKMLELLLSHQKEKVVDFAKNQIHKINIRIQEQKDFDANHNLGKI